jgi:hypothetical protein
MAVTNGTLLLVYADGTLIAAQKGVTFTTSQNLFDTTNKESNGWAEHGNGLRTFEVSIEGLASTTGLSAKELKTYITGRTDLLLVIEGTDYPYVCQADVQSSTITGPMEDATTLSGTFRGNGPVYHLSGTNAQLFTDFDNGDYDTFTEALTVISSAINSAGTAYARSDTFSVTSGDVIKLFTFLTLTSGEAPSVALVNSSFSDISNVGTLAAGANFITLTATDSDATSYLQIDNSAASNFATTKVYCFKT